MANKCNSQGRVILNEKLITLNIYAKDREDVLRKMSEKLLEHGYVNKDFTDAIIEREKNFPTGLQTKSIGVAIPHTDSKYVNNNSIAIGILDKPIVFQNMGSDDESEISIIFMLAIKEPNEQLSMLKKLISIFQDDYALVKILNAKNELEILGIVKSFLGDLVCEG